MRLLLTSASITNPALNQSLTTLLNKPISESNVVVIPTALYGNEGGHLFLIEEIKQLADLNWKQFGVLELSALESMSEEIWQPALEAADCIVVGGGNVHYLSYWMEKSCLFARLPALLEKRVYMGISAGSMIVTSALEYDREKLEKEGVYFDSEYNEAAPKGFGMHKTLPLMNGQIRPHVNSDYFTDLTFESVRKVAETLDVPVYAIDDSCAVQVVDGKVEVVGGGEWKIFNEK